MRTLIALVLALGFTADALAVSLVRNAPFERVIYLSTPSGSADGSSYSNAKALGTDADLFEIPAGAVIENVFVIVDSAVSGTTSIAIGDDDSSTGFLPVAITDTLLATPAILGYPSTNKGSYLKDASSNAAAKYYADSGKEVKLDATGSLTNSGKVRVVIKGYMGTYP